MAQPNPAQIIDRWWERHARPELLRAFTDSASADEPWNGSEDRDLTPDDDATVAAWVSRHRKRSGNRPSVRSKGKRVAT